LNCQVKKNIKLNSKQYREHELVGKVLTAEPYMYDSTFKRAVVTICDYKPNDGAIGFILNKPIKMQITELVADFPEFEAHVSYGGPVATDTIHFVHNVGELIDNSIKVMPGLYWGGDFNKLKFLIRSEMVSPENVRFFVGYSGWEPDQLNGELDAESWIISEMDPNYAFNNRKNKNLWRDVLTLKGDLYSVIAQMPERNSNN